MTYTLFHIKTCRAIPESMTNHHLGISGFGLFVLSCIRRTVIMAGISGPTVVSSPTVEDWSRRWEDHKASGRRSLRCCGSGCDSGRGPDSGEPRQESWMSRCGQCNLHCARALRLGLRRHQLRNRKLSKVEVGGTPSSVEYPRWKLQRHLQEERKRERQGVRLEPGDNTGLERSGGGAHIFRGLCEQVILGREEGDVLYAVATDDRQTRIGPEGSGPSARRTRQLPRRHGFLNCWAAHEATIARKRSAF